MKTKPTATAKVKPYVAKIAREILNLETLETRRMDSLDFQMIMRCTGKLWEPNSIIAEIPLRSLYREIFRVDRDSKKG